MDEETTCFIPTSYIEIIVGELKPLMERLHDPKS